MKKYSVFSIKGAFCSLLATALLLASCSKDKAEEPESNTNTFKRTVSVTFTKGADTKTAVVEGDDKASYIWTTGDQQYFKVYENTVLGTVTNISYSDNMKKATLTVGFNSPTAQEYVYKAKFASSFSSDGNPEIKSEQNPSATSYDPAADVMISDEIRSATGLTSLLFTMNRVVTVNKLTLKGLETDETISKVEVTFDKNVAGFYIYSGNNAGSYSGNSKKLTLTYSGGASVLSDGTFPVYFIAMPVDGVALESVVVYTDKNTYNKTYFTKTYDFAIGQMARFGINMSGYGTPISSSKSYTLVQNADDLVEGAEYLIVATSSNKYFAMGAYTGGEYHPSVEVTNYVSSTTISIDNSLPVEPVILVKNSSGNWLIKDQVSGSYKNYFIAYSDSGNNNMSKEQSGEYAWTITFDNGKAQIKSVTKSTRVLQYNPSSPRFACYTGTQVTPSLYKLDGDVPVLGISFDIPSYSFSIGSNGYNAFVGQTVTKDDLDTRTVTYSISGAQVGSINASTGEVTLDGTTTGTATVTATVGSATGYLAGSVSYTITVTAAAGSNVTDVLTASMFTATNNNYTDFSGVTATSSAIYAGNSALNGSNIQLRSDKSNSGVVTTTSGGRVAKVKVTWASSTSSDRTLDIYAKNTAYSSASDLYGTNKGTKVGTIVCGTSTELTISGDYTYIGLRSNSGAMYISQIEITWGEDSGSGGGGGGEESGEVPTGWLELPTITTGSNIINGTLYGSSTKTGANRNYTYHYDKSYYTALWSAYPLTASHISGSASSTTWYYNEEITDKSIQINIINNSYGTNYGNNTYSRGHQVPAADRKCNSTMRKQTFYVTNQTPQIQNNFNSPMWSNLEGAIRNLTSNTDTVYVVTGAAFRKVGGNETIKTLNAAKSGIAPATIYVPNYYWKVLLKVKWNSSGEVYAASAIGFWAYHEASPGAYTSYATSVAKIEEYTGFDFFANLPSSLKSAAKNNTNWNTFQNF
jgi:endonuclease G